MPRANIHHAHGRLPSTGDGLQVAASFAYSKPIDRPAPPGEPQNGANIMSEKKLKILKAHIERWREAWERLAKI